MNAYFLHKPDGTQTGISVCGRCGQVAAAGKFRISEICCSCSQCHLPLSEDELKMRCMEHLACSRKRHAEAKAKCLENAEIVEDYSGPVYLSDVTGDLGDGFHSSVEALVEELECSEIQVPEFAHCCQSQPALDLDAERILEAELEDSYEGARDDVVGFEEFESAVNAFVQANSNMKTYGVDVTKKVRLRNGL